MTIAVEEAVASEAWTCIGVVTEGRVVNLGTASIHHAATNLGTIAMTVVGVCAVTMAVVASIVGANSAVAAAAASAITAVATVDASSIGTNSATIVVAAVAAISRAIDVFAVAGSASAWANC